MCQLDEPELERQASRERTLTQIRAGLIGQQGAYDGPPRPTSGDAEHHAIAARVLGIAACEIHPYAPAAGEGRVAGAIEEPGRSARPAGAADPQLRPDPASPLGRPEDDAEASLGAVVGAGLGLVAALAGLVLMLYAWTGSWWVRVP